MKTILINGSPNEHGCTYTALSEIAKTLTKNGIETEFFWVGKKPISSCMGCGKCSGKGKCVIDDGVNAILEKIENYDAIVVGSPVHYAAASGQITSFMDRLFYASSGKWSGKVGAAIVSCRRGGAIGAFDQLNKYFSISNMVIATSQYWNQVHGSTPEQVKKDEEGMQTMRTLGENVSWLIKLIEHGKSLGITQPIYEKKVRTNFIN